MKHFFIPIEHGTFGAAVEITLEITLKASNYLSHVLMAPIETHESE